MEKYILDTNIFFNMETGLGLGKKTEEVICNMIKIGGALKKEKKGELFMSPHAVDEFLSFFKDKKQDIVLSFLSIITIKSPETTTIQFPAAVFYEMVSDIRERHYRGLQIGEEEIQNAGKQMAGNVNINKKDFEIKIGSVVKSFRERFRRATRYGFLDSLADLDSIVLAKQQNGFLLSSDEGVLRWARLFGVKQMPVEAWKKRLRQELAW